MTESNSNCSTDKRTYTGCCFSPCVRIAWFIIAVAALIIYAATNYFTYQETKFMHSQGEVWLDYSKADDKLKGQRVAFEKISSNISDIRNLRKSLELTCNARQSTINDVDLLLRHNLERWKAGIALVQSKDLADFSPDIGNLIINFNNWDIAFTAQSICVGKGPSDAEYDQKQEEITRVMKDSIKQSEEALPKRK